MLAARHLVKVWDADDAIKRMRTKKEDEFWVHLIFSLSDVHCYNNHLMAELLKNNLGRS
jgi:hypothetical protein